LLIRGRVEVGGANGSARKSDPPICGPQGVRAVWLLDQGTVAESGIGPDYFAEGGELQNLDVGTCFSSARRDSPRRRLFTSLASAVEGALSLPLGASFRRAARSLSV